MSDAHDGGRARIGAWRLLDLVMATMPIRLGLFGGFGLLPEFGAADARVPDADPDEELPHSNISDHEQQMAIQRERDRRWLTARS